MKVKSVQKVATTYYYVETNDVDFFPEFRRSESGNWEHSLGESWEPWDDNASLEKAFQEYQAGQPRFDLSNLDRTKPTLCLDFDGVLHSYTSGWQGMDVIPDPPVDGAIAFLWDAVEKFQVCIFSTRNSSSDGIVAMQTWLNKHDQLYWKDSPVRPRTGLTLLISFPKEKPVAHVTIDDRAIMFTGKFPSIETLLNFQPWNKRKDNPHLEDGVYHVEYIDDAHVRLTKKAD